MSLQPDRSGAVLVVLVMLSNALVALGVVIWVIAKVGS